MLYLIKQEGKDKNYLKIGFTNDLDKRLKTYNTHNACFSLVDTINNGSKQDEIYLHNQLLNFVYKGEWMIENDKIYIIWEIFKQENRIEQTEHKVDENSENIKLITTILKKKFNASTLEEVLEKLENKNIIL